MKAASIDVLRLLERRGRMDLVDVKAELGLAGDELREAIFELRHLDRIDVDTTAEHAYAWPRTEAR